MFAGCGLGRKESVKKSLEGPVWACGVGLESESLSLRQGYSLQLLRKEYVGCWVMQDPDAGAQVVGLTF